jgi:DNA-binding MarR family transcriptional regulator
MAEPRWLDQRRARVWKSYIELVRELHGELERQMVRESGLSGAEFAVLVPLSEAADGLLRARELGVAVGWDRSRLSHQVSRMEKRGLVVREECPSDARGSMVRLTVAGRSAIEAAAPGHAEAVQRHFFDPLSDEEIDGLGAVLTTLLGGLAAVRPSDVESAAVDSSAFGQQHSEDQVEERVERVR